MTGAGRRLGSLAAIGLLALVLIGPGIGATSAIAAGRIRADDASGPPAAVTIASQTPWVGPGQEFQLRLRIPASLAAGQVTVTVYAPVANRTEFARSVTDHIAEARLARPLSAPVSSLAPDPGGAIVVRIPVQDPTQPRDPARLILWRTGVYPVRVEVRAGTEPPTALVTHILYVAAPITGGKLGVAWIAPIHAAPHPAPDGSDTLTRDDSQRLATLADALKAHRDVPVVLQPTPDTLGALAASAREVDRATLGTLAQLARPGQARQVLASTYVPVSLAGSLNAGLEPEATLALTRGAEVLQQTLAVRPDARTWLEEGPLDETSAAWLRAAQVDQLVVPEAALSPNPLSVTLTHPFELSVPQGQRIRAVAADGALAAPFLQHADAVLAAHQLLADLAVIYLDRPGDSRGVVIATPRGWIPDAAFLDAFLGGMASSPLVSATTLDAMFATVAPATVRRDQPLVRTLLPDARVMGDSGTFPVEAIRSTRRRLDAFGSALDEDNPLYGRLQRILLASLSSDLTDQRGRGALLGVVDRRIADQLRLIQLPTSRTITLTARTGQLPVTVLSGADYPLHVIVRVASDNLRFPGTGAPGSGTPGVSTGSISERRDLRKGNNALDFAVRARTSGAFPLRITVSSPDGRLVLAATTFTVKSSALSGVGLVLSTGAALFLMLWWARHGIRGRRNRRRTTVPPPAAA